MHQLAARLPNILILQDIHGLQAPALQASSSSPRGITHEDSRQCFSMRSDDKPWPGRQAIEGSEIEIEIYTWPVIVSLQALLLAAVALTPQIQSCVSDPPLLV